MINKKIEVNDNYYILINYHENSENRFYILKDKNDKTILENFNRDSFLIKCNKIIKLSSKIENLIASY